jgi:hypothetical protein
MKAKLERSSKKASQMLFFEHKKKQLRFLGCFSGIIKFLIFLNQNTLFLFYHFYLHQVKI